MSREQLLELEDVKRSLLVQAYRMKQEHPHMSPVGIEMEMYSALMAEVKEITTRIQMSAEAYGPTNKFFGQAFSEMKEPAFIMTENTI